MDTVYVLRGTEIRRSDDTIRVTLDNGRKVRLPAETVKHLVVPVACRMNTEVLNFMGRAHIRVSFLDYHGNFSASLEPAEPYASGTVHLAQAKHILDLVKRMYMARTIMDAAAHNIIQNVKYYSYRGHPLAESVGIMQSHRERLRKATTIEQLMGSEGLLRQTYYATWKAINPDLAITRRSRRPPADRVNALISFGNGLMYSACRQALSQTHLDHTLSFIHAPSQARSSLSLDLAELFKPVVVDRLIFRMANRGELDAGKFEEQDGICLLSDSGRESVVEHFRNDMDSAEVDGVIGYRNVILREAYRIEAHLLELEEYHPFMRRA